MPEWRVLTTDNGGVIYHNDKTGEETLESPYLAKLNKYKNCDLSIWYVFLILMLFAFLFF